MSHARSIRKANCIVPNCIVLCAIALVFCVVSKFVQASDEPHFIVGGRVVNDESAYPFMAALYFDPTGSGLFSPGCGGSLIADRWILTAAHCVYNRDFNVPQRTDRVAVLLGETDLVNSSDGVFGPVARIILHPEYDPNTSNKDIALIELTQPFNAPLAVLPSAGSPVPTLEESGVALGWGTVSEGGPLSTKLREVSLPIVSNAACFPFYRDTFDSRFAFCAGGLPAGGQDSCQGDSGGPLIVSRDGRSVVAGLVSYGDGCGREGVPGVYTRVEAFNEWIVEQTRGTVEYTGRQNAEAADTTVITRLAVNTAVSGNVTEGQVAYFDVTGARQVNLTSQSGDSDLYIIDEADFSTISPDSVQCISENATPLDVCVIDDQASSAFAAVFGFSDSNYTLSTQLVLGDTDTVQVLTTGANGTQGFGVPRTGGGLGILYLLVISLLGRAVLRFRIFH